MAMAHGPEAGLAVVAEVEPQLPTTRGCFAVAGPPARARRRPDAAYADLRAAADRTTDRRERDHLVRQAARLRRDSGPGS